jgi:hypothetical protein
LLVHVSVSPPAGEFAPVDLRVGKVGYSRAVRALSGIAAAVVLLAAPAGAMGQAPLPVGEAHGVRIVRERGAIVIVFTDRAARRYTRIAGKDIDVDCTDQQPGSDGAPRAYPFIGPNHPGDITEQSSGGISMRAPKRRQRLYTGDLTRGLDYCRIWLQARTIRRGRDITRIPRRLIVSVPLTQTGAVFLDEESKARRLMLWLFIAGGVAERINISGWPSHSQIVGTLGPEARQRLVSLAAPADAPPPRRVGYYSDRRDHIAVAVLSRSGKRLFIEVAGDVVTTNVAGHILGDR